MSGSGEGFQGWKDFFGGHGVATLAVLPFSYCRLLAFPPPLVVVTIFPRRRPHFLPLNDISREAMSSPPSELTRYHARIFP